MIKPFNRKKQRVSFPPWYDWLLILGAIASCGYMFVMDAELSARTGTIYTTDVVMGTILIFLIMEACRRMMGLPLPIVSGVMLFYAFFGRYFPGLIAHPGYSVKRIIGYLFLGTEGVFGTALNMSSTVIAIFIIFGTFLKYTGTGDFFNDFSLAIFGRVRGGPAKVSVVASTLFGSLSGSAVANVVATGSFTIPLMKKIGYEPHFAGAVEAAASSGGQIMPPVMGATAFVIADVLGMPYLEVCMCALIPALLYYVAVFIQVDLRAVRLGLTGLPADQIHDWRPILKKGWPSLMPIVLLVVLLNYWSTNKVGFWVIVSAIALSYIHKETHMTLKKFFDALAEGGKSMMEVGTSCAISGVVVGVFGLTGLGLKFSNLLVNIADGNMFLLLLMTAIASLILGMGMSTLPVYLILETLVAPALIKMGIVPIAAHLFVFYYGIIAAITPPVAIAAYAGAAIAQDDPIKVGLTACRLGIGAYILPFMFVYGPALILEGSVLMIVKSIIMAIVAIVAICTAFEGYLYYIGNINIASRILLAVGSVCIIISGTITDIIGLGLVILAYMIAVIINKKSNTVKA
jgi:TRAP transporter 4TM/12TM fusion protein